MINIVKRVRRENNTAGTGHIEKDSTLRQFPDGQPFLQYTGAFPKDGDAGVWCKFMIFGLPELFRLLRQKAVGIFIDATFSITPHPFYQVR